MPDIKHEQIAENVRRAAMTENETEKASRNRIAQARTRLAQKDSLPADAPAWAKAFLERMQALEALLEGKP
jgi:hypothetical protein